MVSKKVRELFGPPANLTFAPPIARSGESRSREGSCQSRQKKGKGSATPHRRGGEPPS